MSEHARLSFSASERWLRCPASVNMTMDIREKGESDAAKEGTFAHWVLEKSLNNWLLLGDERIIRFEVPDDLAHIVKNIEMTDYLQPCMDYVIERYELLPGKHKTIHFEQRVDLHYMTGRDDMWGTTDIAIMSDDYIDVLDLKYGKGIFVEADTTQNRLYILGKMCEHMKKTKGDMPWVYVRGTIMQPRYPDEEGNIIRYKEYTPAELDKWMTDVVKPAAGLTDVPPMPVPGEKQCRWCLAKSTCPAVVAKVNTLLGVFEPVIPGEPLAVEIPNVEDLTDDDVEHLLAIHDQIPFINGYLKAVSERIRKLIEARDPRLDNKLKLVVSRRNTKYTEDEKTIIESLVAGKGRTVKDGYIPKKNFVKETPLTASQMLKLKLNDAQKARLQELIKKTEGSLTIVPWSDPRDNAFPPIPFEDQSEYDFL